MLQDWQTNYHEMELNYVFASPFTGIGIDTGAPEGYEEVDRQVSRRMMSLWTNFAKTGYADAINLFTVDGFTCFRAF